MFDFKALLEQAEIGRSRSSVTNPLQWAILIIVVAILAVMFGHGASWLLVFFAVIAAVLVLLLMLAYAYFGLKNPDALRSEKYVLVKAALEKRYAGDSLSGLQEVIAGFDERDGQKLLREPNPKKIDSESR